MSLKQVAGPALRQQGFVGSGQTFFWRFPEVTQIVHFQKSEWNTVEELRFTVNIGVQSCRISQFFGRATCGRAKRPSISNAQWRERIGFLIPTMGFDHWWRLVDEQAVGSAVSEAVDYLGMYGLPALSPIRSDGALRDYWIEKGDRSGLPPVLQNRYVHYLAKELGPAEVVKEYEAKLLGATGSVLIDNKIYLERVGVLPGTKWW